MPISGSAPQFGRYERIDIQLVTGATQILEHGMYVISSVTDVYGVGAWGVADVHTELFVGGAWIDYPFNLGGLTEMNSLMYVYSDGTNVRVANADAAITYRVVGIRLY